MAMTTRNLLLSVSLTALLLDSGAAAYADDHRFDGSKPLLCAANEAFECSPGLECHAGTLSQLRIFRFVRVDFKKKLMTGEMPDGTTETSKIEKIMKLDRQVVLGGVEGDRAWTVTIGKQTGNMVLTAAGEDVAFTVFGACTIL